MDDGCVGYLVVLGIIIYLIYLFIKYVLKVLVGAALIIAGIIAAVGVIVGAFYALRSFYKSIITVYENRFSKKGDGRFASGIKKIEYEDHCSKKIVQKDFFENYSRKAYFMGPASSDVGEIVKNSFGEMYKVASNRPDFTWFNWPYIIARSVAIYVIGTVFTIVLSAVFFVLFLVVSILYFIVVGFVYIVDIIIIKSKGVTYRCMNCKQNYDTPYYVCPVCNIRHMKLKPGSFGVLSRTCVCGTKMPVVIGAKTKYELVGTGGTSTKKLLRYEDLEQECPFCRSVSSQGLSHPISIALIGGKSAGKSTFKVAFLHDFLDEEIPMGNCKAEVAFPTKELEDEYETYGLVYKGRPIRATQRGTDHDIFTYAFSLKNKVFSADRMIQLYDMPGEAFETGDVKEGWNIYSFSEGAVLLIDPYTLEKVRNENQDELQGSTMGNSNMDMNRLITVFSDTLNTVNMKKNGNRFSLPIALVINKADSLKLKKQIGDEAVRTLMTKYPNIFSDYYMTMDFACRCFLIDHGCANFLTNLDNNFECVHFFSCSPMGSIPRGTYARFNPYNVLQIMEWLMLRADAELSKVWEPEMSVYDVPDEVKAMCWDGTFKRIYDDEITRNLPVS